MRSGRVFIRSNLIWMAWYPLRGRRCDLRLERTWCGPLLTVAVGPAYLSLGPGMPTP